MLISGNDYAVPWKFVYSIPIRTNKLSAGVTSHQAIFLGIIFWEGRKLGRYILSKTLW